MKFYSRILGDRDYSLFEVMHFGLRLPGVLSSFGDVQKASVSNWGTLKSAKEIANLNEGDDVTNSSALQKFNRRSQLELPRTIQSSDLENIPFYAFSRIYDVYRGRLIQKRTEKFVALTGNGWPAQAKRSHKLHEAYAKKTLYAYMPCAGLAGTEYIDAIVRDSYRGRYSELLFDLSLIHI